MLNGNTVKRYTSVINRQTTQRGQHIYVLGARKEDRKKLWGGCNNLERFDFSATIIRETYDQSPRPTAITIANTTVLYEADNCSAVAVLREGVDSRQESAARWGRLS